MKRGGQLTGLLGGSFNPAHGGHLRISLFAQRALGLEQVWWLVSPGNPLKPKRGMAPLAARMARAREVARRVPIRVTAIERELGTRYTVETLRKLVRRYPRRKFVWLMGADNLLQFHHWKNWRGIARLVAVAVIARPGYDGTAFASPAMTWFRRYRRRPEQLHEPADRSLPALYLLRFDPDPRSATAIRSADPHWHRRYARASRDGVTHRSIPVDAA